MPVIRAVSVMASRSGRARTKFRTEPMSDTSGHVSLPLQTPASTSKVLCALDSCFPTSDFRPDEDGTIDLTTPENDALYDVVRAQLTGRRPSNTDHDENRRLKNISSTLASRPAPINSQGSSAVAKPRKNRSELAYPLYDYADNVPRPKVIYIKDEDQANEMIAGLNGALGLDLEWPFTSSRIGGVKEGKVALVQLCDADIILLIQVSKMKRFPEKVKELIESPKVPKAGVNIRNDGMKLFRDYGILPSNLVELGALACQADESFASIFNRPIVSLVKVVSYCLHRTLDKGPVRTSDWSKDLTRAQMKYASNDVHSGMMVYKSLMKTARLSKKHLMPERYTVDLAKELEGRSGNDLMGRTSHGSARTASEDGAGPPYRHAYTLWRQGHGLLDICIRMRDRTNPQSETVVISYILRALAEDPALPFSVEALISLVRLDSASWTYHRDTIECWAKEGRGLDGS